MMYHKSSLREDIVQCEIGKASDGANTGGLDGVKGVDEGLVAAEAANFHGVVRKEVSAALELK